MKTLFTPVSLLSVSLLNAQTIDRQIIASSGNMYTTANNKLTFTIGEPVIGKISNTTTVN